MTGPRGVGRREILAGLATAALLGPARADEPIPAESLAAKARRKGICYGSEVSRKILEQDPAYQALVARECAVIVDGIDLLPVFVHPTRDRFDFAGADWVLGFAEQHGLAFRGHNLVWHYSQPPWLGNVTESEAKAVLETYIQTVCSRYAGKIRSWDVVNECLDPDDGQLYSLGKSPWLKLLGPHYIEMAFAFAHAADPAAQLCLNDYGLEWSGRYGDRRRQAMLDLLTRLKQGGTPIHALGTQSHLMAGRYGVDKPALRDFLRKVADLGLEIIVSELDVPDRYLPADPARRDAAIAQACHDLLEVALAEPAVKTVITWGLTDKYSWLSQDDDVKRLDNLPSRGSPFDDALKPKPAYAALAQAFDAAAGR